MRIFNGSKLIKVKYKNVTNAFVVYKIKIGNICNQINLRNKSINYREFCKLNFLK